MKSVFYAVVILFCAAALRFYGVNWDQNQHLHPDERFLTMVASAAKVPATFSEYINPSVSTLNPYNLNFGFFVYGTLPTTLNKIAVQGSTYDSYNGIAIAGRYMSAIADLATTLLVILIGRMLVKMYGLDERLPYISGFLYAVAVLPIQNSHFFTVDALGTFFMTLSVALALRARFKMPVLFISLSGLALGLALATKISSLSVLPLLIGIILISAVAQYRNDEAELRLQHVLEWLLAGCLLVVFVYVTYRVGDPHVFSSSHIFDPTLNTHFKENIAQLKSFSTPSIGLPPSVQWLTKTKILFPLRNIAFFGLGIVYFAIMLFGMIRMGLSKKPILVLISFWVFALFLYLGIQFATTMRYFYPLYPYFAIMGAAGYIAIVKRISNKYRRLGAAIIMAAILVWPLSFMAIYARPHSRVSASEWMYDNIPAKAKILTEYWDDALPLSLPNTQFNQYEIVPISVFDADTPEKWVKLNQEFSTADYYILTSNRGYGSIQPASKFYPKMSIFYNDLFAGTTNFKKVAEFTSYPTLNLGFTAIQFNDQWSEEAFTVYDHPKVTVFRRIK